LKKRKAVFFDRDGVINELVERADGNYTSPWTVDEFRFLPYVKEAVKTVKDLGFMTFVVTNQPGVHDGDMDRSQLDLMNKMIKNWLGVDDILYALDKTSDYYKPGNGMIEALIEKYNIDRDGSYIIGDRWKDIVPGYRSKLTTMFLGDLYVYPHDLKEIQPDYMCIDVLDACCTIMELENEGF
jgi:D-glycero-D-manno-heptose 1,7-bisphosphate phosphatase